MSFLDPKERVIDIEITPHGRYLISKGRFNPEFYRFFDNDIIYDGEYAGLTEEQEDAERRILEETPRLSAQAVFESVDRNTGYRPAEIDGAKVDAYQILEENLGQPLGDSSLGEQKTSSFVLNCFSDIIASIQEEDWGYNVILEPTIFETRKQDGDETPTSDFDGVDEVSDFSLNNDEIRFFPFSDGGSIVVTPTEIFIELREDNTELTRDNFEVELFEVVDIGDGESIYKKVYFPKEESNIRDGIMISEDIIAQDRVEIDPDYNVESIFDIRFDFEIDNDVFCKYGIETKSFDVFLNDSPACEDDGEFASVTYEGNNQGSTGDDC